MRTTSRNPRLPHRLLLFLSILGSVPAFADPIDIANHGFEADNVTGNTLGGQPPANWSQAPVGTVFPYQANGIAYCINKAHTNVKPPVPLPDESEKMAMIRFDVILHQTLTTKVEPNTTYTLIVDAALRNPTPVEPTGATIRLGIGSTVDADLLTPDSELIPELKADSWVLWQATFTTGDTVPDDFLRVEVYWPREDDDGDPQGLFDNVRLDAAPAPAPGFQLTVTDPKDNEPPWSASGPHALPVGVRIRIEWILSGTGGVTQDYLGWYIDDVLVEQTTP